MYCLFYRVFVCLFVFRGFVLLNNFLLIWSSHHCLVGLQILIQASSPFMAIEKWRFLSVPHLLWHGASVYNLQGPVTLTYCRSFDCDAVTTSFYNFWTLAVCFRAPNLPHASLTLLPTAPQPRFHKMWSDDAVVEGYLSANW